MLKHGHGELSKSRQQRPKGQAHSLTGNTENTERKMNERTIITHSKEDNRNVDELTD